MDSVDRILEQILEQLQAEIEAAQRKLKVLRRDAADKHDINRVASIIIGLNTAEMLALKIRQEAEVRV